MTSVPSPRSSNRTVTPGVVLNFDHNDFATTDGARAWTIGWATKMLALKKYAETGQRDPFFA